MKIGCQCGGAILDQTDDLPQKGHLIPDQEWFATYDALDDEVIDPMACGRLEKDQAYHLAREIIRRSSRPMYQCQRCGRLYINDLEGNLQCYVPASEDTSHEAAFAAERTASRALHNWMEYTFGKEVADTSPKRQRVSGWSPPESTRWRFGLVARPVHEVCASQP